jgi:hypothetical protein
VLTLMEQVSKKWNICIVWVGREDTEHEESYILVPDSSSGHVKPPVHILFFIQSTNRLVIFYLQVCIFFVISILGIYFLILSCEM